MPRVEPMTLVEKEFQSKRAQRIKRGDFSMALLSNMIVKSTVKLPILKRGFRSEPRNPKMKLLYRTLGSWTTRFQIRPL